MLDHFFQSFLDRLKADVFHQVTRTRGRIPHGELWRCFVPATCRWLKPSHFLTVSKMFVSLLFHVIGFRMNQHMIYSMWLFKIDNLFVKMVQKQQSKEPMHHSDKPLEDCKEAWGMFQQPRSEDFDALQRWLEHVACRWLDNMIRWHMMTW